MDCNAQMRKLTLQFFDNGIVAFIGDLIAPIRTARQQKPLQVLQQHQIANLLFQHLRRCRRNHGIKDVRLTVITHERTGASRDREGWKAVLGTPAQFLAGELLECGGREANGSRHREISRLLQALDDVFIERRLLKGLDICGDGDPIGCHWFLLPFTC